MAFANFSSVDVAPKLSDDNCGTPSPHHLFPRNYKRFLKYSNALEYVLSVR